MNVLVGGDVNLEYKLPIEKIEKRMELLMEELLAKNPAPDKNGREIYGLRPRTSNHYEVPDIPE